MIEEFEDSEKRDGYERLAWGKKLNVFTIMRREEERTCFHIDKVYNNKSYIHINACISIIFPRGDIKYV